MDITEVRITTTTSPNIHCPNPKSFYEPDIYEICASIVNIINLVYCQTIPIPKNEYRKFRAVLQVVWAAIIIYGITIGKMIC